MHSSKVAAVAVAMALPLIQAQSISLANLPKCAQNAATSGLSLTSCDLTNIGCICSAVEFITTLTAKVQQACSMADQQATLIFAQGLCGQYGVTLNVPAVAAAANAAPSSAAAPAQPASSPAAPSSAASGTPDQDTQDDNPPATTPLAASASSSAEPMSTAPVSPNTFRTSPASPANEGDDSPTPNDVATTTGEARLSPPISTSSVLVYDTESVIPSATIASYPMSMSMSTSADASPSNAQVPTSTTAYRNSSSTANSTVAASSPIPYVGAAIREKVQGAMMMMVAVGGFWGL